MNTNEHKPVMLSEVIKGLNIRPDGIYIDATFGRGGHARAILQALGNEGRLYAMDRDPQAQTYAIDLMDKDARFSFKSQAFSGLSEFCDAFNIKNKVNGIVLDLGVSSPQLDQADRGFSFKMSGPLDMRMDPTQGISAADWINAAKEEEIQTVLRDFGEERFYKRIANAIVIARNSTPITSTEQLAEIVKRANPAWEKHKHPATRSFQAIRIYINRELEELSSCLNQVLSVLAPEGRLVVICFHSLEDRLVKQFIHKNENDIYPKDLPIQSAKLVIPLRRIGAKQKANALEVANNPRSRSAVLRVAEKTKEYGSC